MRKEYLTDREVEAIALAKKKQDMGKKFYEKIPGQYMCRMKKNANGMYEDELYLHPDGRKIRFVREANENIKSKPNFRMMKLDEVQEHFKNLRNIKVVKPYDVIERELNELQAKMAEKKAKEEETQLKKVSDIKKIMKDK